MHIEIEYAVNYLVEAFKQKLNLSPEQGEKLNERLTYHLENRYENHWYSDKPMKGSAYRCINVSTEDRSVDLVLRQAAEDCQISMKTILNMFSKGLALWVDPNDVSCRLGKGAIFPIYKKIKENDKSKLMAATQTSSNNYYQRRPQQRPRSSSPPHQELFEQNTFKTRPRSTTPPGFTTYDAGQLFQQSYTKKPSLSADNLQKLWNTIPNTTNTMNNYRQQPSTYTSARSSMVPDSSFSFNQYSSYYNSVSSNNQWKKNHRSQYNKPQKANWQDDEVYNRYHWSRRDENNSAVATASNCAINSYAYSAALQAQEVC